MALLEKETQNTLFGIGIGAGAVLAFSYLAPVLGAVARPLAKALIAAGMDGFEKASQRFAHAAESLQDLVAEVQLARSDRNLPTPVPAPIPGRNPEAN